MRPRIEKKVSKKLMAILGDALGKVWIDDELELFPPHWKHNNGGKLTPKQMRENRQQQVAVNHMPSIGGGLDYWGEGTDWDSVYQRACNVLMWEDAEFDGEGGVTWKEKQERINARWCLRKAKEYMERQAA